MALYDDVIAQQTSRYPGNVLEISIPPPASRLERYPGETEMGVGVSPAILELMKQRQRWSPPQDVPLPQDVPPMRVVPDATISRAPAPQPFGFHPLYNEQNASLWQMLGLPERYHPALHRLAQAANLPPRIISAQASIPHQVISSVLHPLFRLLFTGTPFSHQNALTRRFPGLSPGLPGRTAMGALADPAASLATVATEGEVAPEKLFGGARHTQNMWQGNPKGWGLQGTIPGAVYDTAEDLATGTTRRERALKDLNEKMYWKDRMDDEEALALRAKLPTQPLGGAIPELLGPGKTRQGPFADVPPQWYEKNYGGTDYMDRYEKYLRLKAAIEARKKKIPVQIVQPDLTKK